MIFFFFFFYCTTKGKCILTWSPEKDIYLLFEMSHIRDKMDFSMIIMGKVVLVWEFFSFFFKYNLQQNAIFSFLLSSLKHSDHIQVLKFIKNIIRPTNSNNPLSFCEYNVLSQVPSCYHHNHEHFPCRMENLS